MATETTTPSESTMNESIEEKMEELCIEKIEDSQKAVDTSIPETETLQDHDSLKAAETETPKEQDSHEITDNSSRETSNVQEIPIVKEKDAFENAPEFAEKESSNEQEVLKDKVHADANTSDLVTEEKWKNEASESVEADTEKEVNVAEVREVSIPTVDHRSGAGDESKTEDVPTTVVHETTDGVNPSPPRSGDLFQKVNVAEVREVLIPTVDHRSGAGDESKTEDVPTTVVHETTDGVNPSPRSSGDIFQNVGSKMMQSVQKLKNVISGKSSKDKSSESTD